jgi:WD40 repeat protein
MQKLIGCLVFIFLVLVQSLLAQELELILPVGHTGFVTSAVFSPDGKRVLTASWDHTAKLWDAGSGMLLKSLEGHTSSISAAVFSPDGKKILTVSYDATAKLWDAVSGDLLKTLQHTSSVEAGVFSPDGKTILTASGYETAKRYNTAKTWDAASGALLKTFEGHTGPVKSAVFSPDGKEILTASEDSTAKLWDAASGTLLKTFEQKEKITAAVFSLNGKKIFTTSRGKEARLWDAVSGDLLKIFTSQDRNFSTAVLSPDAKTILTASYSHDDYTARIWDAVSGDLLKSLEGHQYWIIAAVFSRDGSKILTASHDGTARLWDAASGMLLKTTMQDSGRLASAVFSPDERKILTASYDGTAKLWDAASGALLKSFERHTSPVSSVAFSPDGKKILTAFYGGAAKLWDAASGSLLKALERSYGFTSAVYSLDGKKILATYTDGTVRLWDATSGMLLKTLQVHKYQVSSAVFSPDGQNILTVAKDTLKVWDAASGMLLKTWESKDTHFAVFSPDGKTILATYTWAAGLLNAASGRLLHTFRGHQNKVMSAVFSSNAKTVLTASWDNTAKLWDAASGSLLITFKGHTEFVQKAVFSPDDKKVLTASDDHTAKLWDAATGRLLNTLKHRASFTSAAFSQDGKMVLTASYDKGTAKIWDAASGNLLKTLEGDTAIHNMSSAVFSPDGKKVVTTSTANTIKLWDVASGLLLFTFFAVDSTDYFVQIPEGYYHATPQAAKQLHYVTRDLKPITFEQLDLRYNRPDKVLEAVGNPDTALIAAYRQAYNKRIKKLGIDTSIFKKGYTVPEAAFVNQGSIEYEQTKGQLVLHINAKDSAYPLERWNLWVNEVPLFGMRGISLNSRHIKAFDTVVTITLSQGDNRLETSVTNANGMESYRSPLLVHYIPVVPVSEKLYFIGIGINEFLDSTRNLDWCVKDISDLANRLKTKYGVNCEVHTLFNQSVTLQNIKALKQNLLQSTINDKVIVVYSGHGLLSKDFNYILSTYAVNFEKPEQNGLPYEELENLVDSLPARKKLLLLDACHSGEVDKEELEKMVQVQIQLDKTKKGVVVSVDTANRRLGIKNSFDLMQELFVNVSKSTGATIISAAAGTQFALERGDLKNGVFTYAILEAMEKNKTVMVSKLKNIIEQRVEELTQGLQRPTSRNGMLEYDWQVW